MLGCGKCSIGAVSGAGTVGAHDPEMICGARTEARNVRAYVLIIIPNFCLVGRSRSVAGGSSILKVHRCTQPVRIYGPVKSG